MNTRIKKHKSGFTLVEIMLVVAIIATLFAIVSMSYSEVRKKAATIACMSTLKNINTIVEAAIISDEINTHDLRLDFPYGRSMIPFEELFDGYGKPSDPFYIPPEQLMEMFPFYKELNVVLNEYFKYKQPKCPSGGEYWLTNVPSLRVVCAPHTYDDEGDFYDEAK